MASFMDNAVPLVVVFCGLSWAFLPSISKTLEVCELCSCYELSGINIVNCSSSGVPEIIPDGTKSLDLSNNGISSLGQYHVEVFKKVQILDLSNNPFNCDCHLARSIKELTSASSDVREVKGRCSRPRDLVGVNIGEINHRITQCNSSTSPLVSHRVRRSTDPKQCIPGTPDCSDITCGGRKLWLPTTMHWGCCYNRIHELTTSYCQANMGVTQCTSLDFRCANQHCLPRVWVCNGYNDCQDGSDELGCPKCGNSSLFLCKNGNCISKDRVCDTYNDCGDGSDEMFCRFSFDMGWCGSTEYRCPKESCVSHAKLCDGVNDCGDNSDEQGCLKDSTKKCPDGWIFLNQHCYIIEHQSLSWSTAQITCVAKGGHLTKITSQDEEEAIKTLITAQHSTSIPAFWIGLSRSVSGFQWTDSMRVGKYTSWEYGEPSIGKNCIMLINNTMKWRAENCDRVVPFICSRDPICKHRCQNSGTCQSSKCVCADNWSGEDCSFKYPNITTLKDIKDMTVPYNFPISLNCQSTGVPRPNMEWLVNGQVGTRQQSVEVSNEPFVSNITIHVKTNTEVTCTSKNRGGLDTVRIRVTLEDNDVVNMKAMIRLTNMQHNNSLENPMSEEYLSLTSRVTNAISSLYQDKQGYKGASVLTFRSGSLTCEVLLRFSKNSEAELTQIFQDAITSGMLVNLTVDSQYLVLEKKAKVCPPDFFNVTWFALLPSNIRVQRCPHGSIGTAKRKCNKDGEWEHPDYTRCVTQDIMHLKHRIATALNKTTPSPNEIRAILHDLVKKSSRKKGDAKIAGDIKTCAEILKKIVVYNTKHSRDTEKSVENIQNFLASASNLLDYENKPELVLLQESDNITSKLISVLEGFGLQAAGGLNTSGIRSKQYVADNIVMGITLVPDTSPDDVTFPNYTDQQMTSRSEWDSMRDKNYILLPKSTFNSKKNTARKVSRVSSLLYRTLSAFLDIPSAYSKLGNEFLLSSNVISASIKPSVSLEDPVKTIYGEVQNPEKLPACVFWDFNLNSKNGAWSRDGCSLSSRDGTKVTCECDHLTNFAVLMDISGAEGHKFPLRIISSVGCAISLLGLVITLFVHFIFWRNLKSEKTIIHVNLCVALLVANIILLAGLESTKYKSFCTAVAALLHYFFLCALAWMLVEGMQIYVAIVMVFQFERKRKYFYLIGWGMPLLIVGVSMVVTEMKGYGGENACWLSSEGGLIFAFIGPVLAVVLVNIIIFILVMRAMMTTHKMMSADEIQKARVAAKCCAVLLPLLGLTWLFGVLAVDRNTIVFLYLFAIFNSLQGFFIFIFHCLLDIQVQTAIKSWSVKRDRTESNLALRALSSSSNPINNNRLDTRTTSAASALPVEKKNKKKIDGKDSFDTVVV